MSRPTNSKIQSLWRKFSDKLFRESFSSSLIGTRVAAQIQTLREDRGMSQSKLAELTGMQQSRISLLEDPSYDRMNMQTLKRIAAAFDVGLSVSFVPFSELLQSMGSSSEHGYSVRSFSEDAIPETPSKNWALNASVITSDSNAGSLQIHPKSDFVIPSMRFVMKDEIRAAQH